MAKAKRPLEDPRLNEARQTWLRGRPAEAADGRYVLYWMQRSQRAEDNHALEAAVALANDLGVGVLVAFGLMDDYPDANLRHYRFMAEGLRDVRAALGKRKIPFVVRHGHPVDVALEAAKDACLLVCDRGYLRHLRQWRERVADEAPCPVLEVETDVIVPVEAASPKREYAARTIRPKLQKRFDTFCALPEPIQLAKPLKKAPLDGLDARDPATLCEKLKLDRSVGEVSRFFEGGSIEARRRLQVFLEQRLDAYSDHRNQPQTDDTTHMSAHLHFGQISPIRIAVEALDAGRAVTAARQGHLFDETPDDPRTKRRKIVAELIEELMVRRELAFNYVWYEPRYDRFEALPDWARQTLGEHADDDRPESYGLKRLEQAETEDPYWNAAMREMVVTGYMHNYMRMYWGKKILEWTKSPQLAFKRTLHLNNKYFLDGRDPNSYANVGWIFGLHDRPWQERAIYGKVRTMTAAGLERKCDIRAYVAKIDAL
jgi:deoxyribodipyrimidine photo-lyase